ncbi:hypothetical protein V8E54_002007 [Elaphomyces granulatus]
MNTLDDATYHSNLASAAPDATPEPEEIFEAQPVAQYGYLRYQQSGYSAFGCTDYIATWKVLEDGARPQPYAVQYQNVENVVRFLLGHTQFKDNLTYSPIRLWNDNNSRCSHRWGPVCLIVYARAAIGFWTLAQYSSHDDNTLEYMEHALYQIDMLKSAFRKYRINNRNKDKSGHFNIPKFHAITHYPEFIRMFGTTDGVDNSTQMDRQGAFFTDKQTCRFPGAD